MECRYRLDYGEYGKRLKQARNTKGYTQSELAELVHVSQNMIGKLETNKATVSLQTFLNIANALNTDINVFVCDCQPGGKTNTDLILDDMIQDLAEKEKKFLIQTITALKANIRE